MAKESPRFVDATSSWGLEDISPGELVNIASYGPGISLSDCDGDGDLDLFITPRFHHFGPSTGDEENYTGVGNSILLRNEGNHFTNITKGSGIELINSTVIGSAWGDYDNDGDVDVYLSNYGYTDTYNTSSGAPNSLHRNDGNCIFTDVTLEANVANPGHSSTALWADYDHDGDLDLYSMNIGSVNEFEYRVRAETNILYKNQLVETGVPNFIDDTLFAGVSGQIEFSDIPNLIVSPEPVNIDVASPSNPSAQMDTMHNDHRGSGLSWAGVFFDYDNDGWEDLFVASDFAISPIYRNNGNGTFTVVTHKLLMNRAGTGMGAHASDIDGDGDLDLCQTNFGPNYIWLNSQSPNGNSYFKQIQEESGISNTEEVNWACLWFDHDLDADQDLFFGVGRISPYVWVNNNSFYVNDGTGSMTDVTDQSGLEHSYKTMGVAMGDIDNDGDIDLVLGNSDGPIQMMLSQAAQIDGNTWISIRLEGNQSNSRGIGARVTIVMQDGSSQTQMVYAGQGFLGTSDSRVHFGLNKNTVIKEVKVLWSTGHEQVLHNVAANQFLLIKEDAPIVSYTTSSLNAGLAGSTIILLSVASAVLLLPELFGRGKKNIE